MGQPASTLSSGSQAKCGKIAAMVGKAFEWNPIWVREMRARWRGWRAFALLAAYVTILAGVLLWRYNDFLNGWQARSLKYSPAGGEIALSQMLGAALVLAASSWCVTSIGLTFSWFNRRVIAAMCWTMGTLFAWWVAAPVLLLSTATYETSRAVETSCQLWHPGFALFALFDQRSPSFYETAGGPPGVLRHAAPVSFLLFLVGAGLLFALWRGVLAFREGAN